MTSATLLILLGLVASVLGLYLIRSSGRGPDTAEPGRPEESLPDEALEALPEDSPVSVQDMAEEPTDQIVPSEVSPDPLLEEVAPAMEVELEEELAATDEGSVREVEEALRIQLADPDIPETPELDLEEVVPQPEPIRKKRKKKPSPIEELEALGLGLDLEADEPSPEAEDESPWMKELEAVESVVSGDQPLADLVVEEPVSSPAELPVEPAQSDDFELDLIAEDDSEEDLDLEIPMDGDDLLDLDALGDEDEPSAEPVAAPAAEIPTEFQLDELELADGVEMPELGLPELEFPDAEKLPELELSELEPAAVEQKPDSVDSDWFREVVEEVESEEPQPTLPQEQGADAEMASPQEQLTGADRLLERTRRLARVIVNDIKLYYPEKLELGVRQGNIRESLEDEIRRGRRLFLERVSKEVPDREQYFEESLREILAGGNEELLGPR